MPRELIYTAADEGIDGLRGCLCYAGASNDALSNKLLLQNLLAINNYQELYKAGNPKAHSNPIGFSHYRFNAGARDCSVISRIGPAPLYANRTNFIAHHVILDDIDKAKAGPAWAINNFKFRDHWSPQIGRIDAQRLAIGSLEPKVCNYWKSIVGDAGWAGWLAERALSGKPITVLYPTGSDPLALIQEAIALLPEYQRWNITFSTYYTLGGRGPNCTLRFIPLDADSLAAPFSDKTFHDGVLNLSRGLGNAPTGALVNLARGEKPKDKAIPTGLGGTNSPIYLPSFDPNKSDIPGLKPSKDPLFSKSELFIDTKDNSESFDNLKPSGPDNTWKTIAFLAGIFGLLFLLVLPPLFTWLIASSINQSKLTVKLDEKETEFNTLKGIVEKLEIESGDKKIALDKLTNESDKIKNKNKDLESEIGKANGSNKGENIVEVKSVEQIKSLLNDSKLKEKTGFKTTKDVFVELQKLKSKQEIIITDGPKENKWLEFIDKNKGKVLEKGDVISKYIVEIEKNAKAKYEQYNKDKNNVKIYYQTKQWIEKDKDTFKGMEDLVKLKKEFPENLKKIKEAKLANDFGVSLPLSHLVVLTVLIKKNEKNKTTETNLFFMNECRGSLKELIEVLLDDNKERFFSKSDELTKYVSSFPDNAKLFWEPLVATENSRKIGPFTVSNEDLSGFIKEFENYLGNLKLKGLNDTKKFIELIKFSQMELSNFFYGKAK